MCCGYLCPAGSGDWHLRSLLSQLIATIDTNPSDLVAKPGDYHGMERNYARSGRGEEGIS